MPLTPLRFDNAFIAEFSADPEPQNVCRQVEQAYSLVQPTSVVAPKLIAYASDVAELIGFSQADLAQDEFAHVFVGNQQLDGMKPYALCYGGHQFGQWAGQLGDGRAINLGEIVTAELGTSKHGHQTLQLKGAGKTPYSRHADGLAVLRSSVREFLCSEAMHHLGVPTTRALSLCLTGEQVMRDMFYDGRAALELGAVVCRVSPSFLRFGSFQLPASRGDKALLKQLVAYSIRRDFPHLCPAGKVDALNQSHYLAWFAEIAQRSCEMVIHWQRVGFVHGVMNTDNMSIIGETIDYGPYGWLEDFDPNWTPNTTDAQGKRYRYGAQPKMVQWNLYQLANSLYVLIDDAAPLEAILGDFADRFNTGFAQMMADKLGLTGADLAQSHDLFNALETLLSAVETDMTVFYRQLAKLDINQLGDETQLEAMLAPSYYQPESIDDDYRSARLEWLINYQTCCQQDALDDNARRALMNRSNPKYVLRNYLAQQVIEAAEQGDYAPLQELQRVLKNPYDEQAEFEQQYAQKRPEWARHKAGCSMLSCSS